jgi:hypothetical protein
MTFEGLDRSVAHCNPKRQREGRSVLRNTPIKAFLSLGRRRLERLIRLTAGSTGRAEQVDAT